jgi:ribosome-dependent ATPase
MSVIVATAYMDEAQRFDWLVAMDDGRCWPPARRPSCWRAPAAIRWNSLHRLLPEEKRGHAGGDPALQADADDIAIEAADLTMRFGDFVVDM